jgi:hypothetical protein
VNNPDDQANQLVPVKLTMRQLRAITSMDGAVSQFVREAVEEKLLRVVPGYFEEVRRASGLGWPPLPLPPLEEMDLYGET